MLSGRIWEDASEYASIDGSTAHYRGESPKVGAVIAEDPLAFRADAGQIRRLTILFADLVDSTVLSTQVEPEVYRTIVGRYRDDVARIVKHHDGYITSTRGDGLLALFGFPDAHEDDVRRAVLAGLAIVDEVRRVGAMSKQRWGIELAVRVGVHRGPVYLDTDQGDVYGFGANLAARVSSLAAPDTVVVSDAVERLLRHSFELEPLPPVLVKGVDEPVAHHRVVGERVDPVIVVNAPLVGREAQQGLLERFWAKAQSGQVSPPCIWLRGESGIGKSRLASLAGELVEQSGGKVLELTGSAFHSRAGLHPVRTLLERRCGTNRLTDHNQRLRMLSAEIASTGTDPTAIPLLAPVLGIGPEAGYEPVEADSSKLYDMIGIAVRDYLLTCLGAAPALLVAEDAHWFDPSTMEVLSSLVKAADGRLLVIVTARPQLRVPADWPVEIVDLEPLTDNQADELICALNPSLTPSDRETVRRRCDGVPFYLEQVVSGLDHPGVPEALYEPLFARLRASLNAVPVAEAAGVIGRQVDRGLLGAVCTLNQADLDRTLEELEDARVLERRGTDGWRFRHELLREVAVELAPPSVRRRLHSKVADALVCAGGDVDWGVVAGHYERAERFAEAADAYHEATSAARSRGALTEARTYLTRALSQLDLAGPGEPRDRKELALRMERGWLDTAADGALCESAASDFARCRALIDNLPLDDEVIDTRLDLAEFYVVQADLRGTLELLESLRPHVGPERPWTDLMVQIWFGIVGWLRGDFLSAQTRLQESTDRFAESAGSDVEVYNLVALAVTAYSYLAATRLVRGDVTGAKAALKDGERLTGGLGFPEGEYSLAYVQFVEIWLNVESGDLATARALAADLTAAAEKSGVQILRDYGTIWSASISALSALVADRPDPDQLAAHVDTLTELYDALRTSEQSEYVVFFGAVIARTLIAAGRTQQARADLDALLEQTRNTEMRFYEAELLRFRAKTHLQGAARSADIAEAVEMARRQGALLFELRAILDGTPDDDLGADALRRVVTPFPSGADWPELYRARALLQDAGN